MEQSSVGAESNQCSKMSQETSSSSSESCRHPNCNCKSKTKCPVTLNEIYFNGDSTTAAANRFSDREELPNEMLNVHLHNVAGLLINGFRRELAADGLDLVVENGNLRVSGFAPKNDYNGNIEVKAKMVKFLTRSKSFPQKHIVIEPFK